MTRLQALNPDTTAGKTKDLFNAVQKKLGMVPNMVRTMANSFPVLNGYLSFSGALETAKIGPQLAEQISLVVAEANQCEYCLSAHTLLGSTVAGIDETTIILSRTAETGDRKTDAALNFALAIVQKRGLVSDADVAAVRNAGYTEGEITEIIAHTALNIFTNYFNNVANTVNDFPKIALLTAKAA